MSLSTKDKNSKAGKIASADAKDAVNALAELKASMRAKMEATDAKGKPKQHGKHQESHGKPSLKAKPPQPPTKRPEIQTQARPQAQTQAPAQTQAQVQPQNQPQTKTSTPAPQPQTVETSASPAPSAPPSSPATTASAAAPPLQTKTTAMTKPEKAAPTAAPVTAPANLPHVPDAAEWTAFFMRVAERSHKILKEFSTRNKTMVNQLTSFDPAHLSEAFLKMSERLARTPEAIVTNQISLWQDYARLMQLSLARMSGQQTDPVIKPETGDKRFQDEAWDNIWIYDFIKQSYLLTAQWLMNLVHQAKDVDPQMYRKVDFYTRQFIDALSPTNFLATNPEVVRTTLATGGENIIKGLEHLLGDLERGHGQLLVSMSDNSAFHFGKNIATTPGKVVFQNELFQLLQFSPETETVFSTPFLIIPPWINKYYILDLRENNSMIRYLVRQGHTVFCISWVNPDSRHANIGFEDYMTMGPVTALRQIARITGESKVNALGYCIGGTLLSCTLAWLKAHGNKEPEGGPVPEVNSATFLVTLVDFSEPGEISVFIDEDQVSFIEALMAPTGYLAAPMMGTAFSMMRANDLIWSFVVNNYLLGKDPFPFDLLTWNSDSTNLPAAMQSFYLRNMYLENNLVKPGGITLKGIPIDVRKIDTPVFLLSTREDHITPWKSTYKTTQLYSGEKTFVLSGSGHIAGVVNPPDKKKYGYWTNPNCPADPEEWLNGANQNEGSWWPEWAKWLSTRAGHQIPARVAGANNTAKEDAPGSYVLVRAV